MSYTLKKGTTSRMILLDVRDAAQERTSMTGLSHATSGASAAYVREGASVVNRISLCPGVLGTYKSGGFVEVDPVLMPGVYQLGVPDAAFEPGADTVLLVVTFPGVRIDPIEINLVAYDPQDEQRLGMTALGPEGRIAALRGAFPRLTARELVEEHGSAADS